jgi:hypothetical protein
MKIYTYKLSLALLLTSLLSYSQTPTIAFSKFFGGNYGQAKSIQKTTDGGYIVAGYAENAPPEVTNYFGGWDGFVVKINAAFELEWAKCYGTANGGETISQIKQTSDGGFIFVGNAYVHYANSTVGTTEYDYWIVKTDATGTVQWEKKYGGSKEDRACSVEETSTGEFVVDGWSGSTDGTNSTNYGWVDYWLLKLNATGDILLNKKYGGSDDDTGYGAVVNSDGSIVMVGESYSENNQVTCTNPIICESSFWVVKTNALGNIAWSKCVGSHYSGANYANRAQNIIKSSDGGYVVVGSGWDGSIENTYGASDFWAVKYDTNGNQLWRGHYGGSGQDEAYSIRQTSDGGYVIVGSTYSEDGLVTVNLGTYSYENGWMIKINAAGELEWQKSAGSSSFGFDLFNDVVQSSPTEYVVVGKAGNSNDDCAGSNGRGFWITKVNYDALSTSNQSLVDFDMYPNPTNAIVSFKAKESITKISITDSSGRIVLERTASEINQVDVSSLSAGAYTLTASNAKHSITKKLIKN